ncbi:major facilitator superfamily domain-containing protein [Mycena leptocephala]|nr:major facilitator superfamily domain-containing protein [Mycena leptocephala]
MADMDDTDSRKTETQETSGPDATLSKGESDCTATFPEGGFRGWATVAGAYTTSFGVYQDFYTRYYLTQSSASAISWIGSINAFIIISVGLVGGRYYDRGHFQLPHCLRRGSPSVLQHVHAIALQTATTLSGSRPGSRFWGHVCPKYRRGLSLFQKRHALAMAIVASGSSLGAVVHPIMLNNTLQSLGFENAVRASSALVSGLLIVACLLMRPRLQPSPTHLPFWRSLQRFARDKSYVFTIVGISTYFVGVYFPLFFLQLDAVKHGINQKLSFYSLVIMNGSSIVGRLAPGFFAQRLGIINVFSVAMGCGAVFILSMIALRTIASVVVIGVLYGLCIGVYITLIPPILAILTEDMGELGLRMGVAFAVFGVGGLVGPPINGALLTGHFVWWRPALFSGLMACVGFSCFLVTFVDVRRRSAKRMSETDAKEVQK